jgi:ribosomal protein S18 acetylase RimI-like enzyme
MPSDEKISLDDGLFVRRATLADLDRVLAVVHDATRRVQERGFDNWRLYLTDEGLAQVRRRLDGVGGAEVYLAVRTSDDHPLGAFAVEWSDCEIWGEARGNDGRAGYVHMLSVHRVARGTAMGERMLSAAENIIAARGREFFRLDCWRRSEFLRGYYARLGFTLVEDDLKQGSVLWEKRVAPPARK